MVECEFEWARKELSGQIDREQAGTGIDVLVSAMAGSSSIP
jgi:hypothetical protein